jgi:hypothetical protein
MPKKVLTMALASCLRVVDGILASDAGIVDLAYRMDPAQAGAAVVVEIGAGGVGRQVAHLDLLADEPMRDLEDVPIQLDCGIGGDPALDAVQELLFQGLRRQTPDARDRAGTVRGASRPPVRGGSG